MTAGCNAMHQFVNYLDTLPPLMLLFFASGWGIWASRERFIGYYLISQVVLNGLANLFNELDWRNLYLYHLNVLFSFALITCYFWELFTSVRLHSFLGTSAL